MNVRRTFVFAVTSVALVASHWLPAQQPAPKADGNDPVKLVPALTQPPANVARPVPPQPPPIQKPADPARVRATYEINGARVPITEGEFYEMHQRLEKLEPRTAGRALDVNRVYEQILALAEGKALGLEATPEEVALFDPLAKNPDLAAANKARYEKEGITPEMYATYQKEVRTIQKAKDLFANSMRILSNDVFDAYRRDHFSFRLEYVEFPASRYAEEMNRTPPTDKELEAFWNEDKSIQNRYRSQSTITAEFVSFDPQATSQPTVSDREVPRAEALDYYNKNKTRLDTLITPQQRAELYPSEKVELSGLKTPFQILRPVVEREIRLSGRIRAAFEEAKKAGAAADLAAIASKAGLTYERIEAADREAMTTRHSKYGPQIFSVLSNHNPGDLPPELKVDPQLQFFYRLIGKEASKLPEFATVKEKLLAPYIETTSLNRAKQAAQAMRTWIDQKIDAEVRAEEEKLTGEAQTAADAEIKTRGITQKPEIDAVGARHKATAQAQVRKKKDALAPKYFAEYVKENSLELHDTGLFEAGNPKREAMKQDEMNRIMMFIKTNPQIRSMEPGQITAVMTDAATKTQIIARMAERAEPDFSTMSDGELLTIRATTERSRSYQPVQRWQFADISRRRELKIE